MLSIRLSRIGKKNKPMYRLIICERSRDPHGRSLEILGSYNPHTKELGLKKERVEYWISKGAKTTPTVNNILINKGIIKGEKIDGVKLSQRRRKKIDETKKADEAKKADELAKVEAAKKAEEEAKKAAEAAPVAELTATAEPVEEPKAA